MQSQQVFCVKPESTHPVQQKNMDSIFCWGIGPGCVQGMDELITCNRLEEQDEWLLEVQHEFRENSLSVDNHAFLHGRPTSKPGSWTNGQTTCGNPTCSESLQAIAKDTVSNVIHARVSEAKGNPL